MKRFAIVIAVVALSTSLQAQKVAPTASVPKTSTAVTVGWNKVEEKSAMDDSRTVVLSLQAEREVSGWQKTSTPTLLVRCKEHSTSVYVHIGMPANPELGRSNRYSVRVRLGPEPAVSEVWTAGTNDESLFSAKPRELAQRIVKVDKLLFEFTPFRANPAIAEFNVKGLSSYLDSVAEACGWAMDDEKEMLGKLTTKDYTLRDITVPVPENLTITPLGENQIYILLAATSAGLRRFYESALARYGWVPESRTSDCWTKTIRTVKGGYPITDEVPWKVCPSFDDKKGINITFVQRPIPAK